MNSPITIFQTLDDKDNYIECEETGPFPCSWDNTWVGEGYYFWYHHIEPAHWWGESRYGKKKYVIFQSSCHDLSKCWDLHGNGEHQSLFLHWLGMLKKKGKLDATTTVAQVIEFIKNEYADFKYEGIRILGVDSISKTKAIEYNMPRLPFEISNYKNKNNQKFKAYFELIPPVQICLFARDGLGRKGFEVVFPEEYRSDYSIVF